MMIRGEWIERKIVWTIAVLVMILSIELYVLFTPQTTPTTLVCNGSDCALFPSEMVSNLFDNSIDECEKVRNVWKCPEYKR